MEEVLLTEQERKRLLEIVRTTLSSYLKDRVIPSFDEHSPGLLQKSGVFVTLKKGEQLRGCIGIFTSDQPLFETASRISVESATQDPRFMPVQASELPLLHIEISVLSPLRVIKDVSEIEVGKHGIFITKGYNRGVLLPQVATEYGWDRETFLQHTCMKAGLPPDTWKKNAKIEIFSAEVFGE